MGAASVVGGGGSVVVKDAREACEKRQVSDLREQGLISYCGGGGHTTAVGLQTPKTTLLL
jgi:hypothetical protein